MKRKINLTRIARCLTLLSLIFFACLISARAQVKPFVDCAEKVDGSNYRVYFGYSSLSAGPVEIPIDGPRNFFSPIPDPPGQPDTFYPGVHHRAVAVTVPNATNETWFLGVGYATSSAQILFPCNDAGSNTRTITYQGRLTDANAAANGQYDLRFQLFDATTDGTAQTATLALEDVQVTNGIFTVQLDFGLPVFLNGGNIFVEIAVRPGAATGAYTTLAPHQPLTTTPYAIRAQSAANADLLNGVTADQFVRTNDARLSDARTPTAGSGNYIQNTTTQQTNSNFNISGTGAANVFDATVQFNIGGNRILSSAGTSNLFAGVGAGSANTGSGNSFFGALAGASNTTGVNNTVIGQGADVGAGNLSYATAIGSGAVVRTSNTIALGRENGSDLVRIFRLGSAGTTQLCLSAINEISNCSSSLRYKTNIAPFSFGLSFVSQLRPISFDWLGGGTRDVGFGAEDLAKINPLFVTFNAKGEVEGVKYDRLSVVFVNAFKEQQTQIERQQKQIDELKNIVCAIKPDAEVCKLGG